ncbi:MAG: hypothetical protein Q9O74_10335 [Planctomycetota bacterium]|nr:hypothetical protein [Planctomycetota bacterium]
MVHSVTNQRPFNPWRAGRVLGGHMVPGTRLRFGGFGVMPSTVELLAARPECLPDVHFSDTDDEVIRKSFEEIRDGMSVDRMLADPVLTKRFNSLCRTLGVRQSAADINRRLLRMRKASGGGILRRTTVADKHPGLLDRFGPAVEPAMVKMLVRYGASVDDLLADPELGESFEAMARATIEGGTSVEYRLCALQIRKSRYLTKADTPLFQQLDLGLILDEFIDLGSVAERSNTEIPDGEGIAVLLEPTRPLLVSRFKDLQSGVNTLASRHVLEGLGADTALWRPDPRDIQIRAISAEELPTASVQLWELRLIGEWRPVFNWPLRAA